MWMAISDVGSSQWWFWVGGLSLGLMALGGGFGGWRALKHRRRNQWLQRVQVSLTGVRAGVLTLRTLWEGNSIDVLLSQSAVQRLLTAVRQSNDSPFPTLDSHEYRFYLNAAINHVSALTTMGHFAADQNLSVHVSRYVLGWVREKADNVQGHKLRILVVSQNLLEQLPELQPQLEHPDHSTRWETLQQMARIWRENPIRLGQVEIVLANA